MHGPMGESHYTKAVVTLVKYIQSYTPLQDSLFEQAQCYFQTSDQLKSERTLLQDRVKSIEMELEASKESGKAKISARLKDAQKALKKVLDAQQLARTKRYESVIAVSTMLLRLAEADSWKETQVSSAKLLGTLQLLSPGEGKKLAHQNQKLKPAYKCVIALRLLDRLLLDGQISHQYINQCYQPDKRYSPKEDDLTVFQRNVAIPVIIASMLQDIGLLHPKAQLLLKGGEGKLDEFRVLEKQDRLDLLKLNHEHTLDYITYGLGMEQYIGNSKEEKINFDQNEKQRMNFTRTLLIDALKPKLGVGNLIKAPQIYASVIFSSKQSYNFLDLPKACLVVAKAAKAGAISQVVSDSLLAIVGHFPQGYGITYIPQDSDNVDLERYEYAIVTELNPDNPYVPRCRVATRNLTFLSSGQVIPIKVENNLYFPAAKKKLERISPERLEEILSKLVSNFEERKDLDLIPSYWNPYDFFSYKRLQNLWKKT